MPRQGIAPAPRRIAARAHLSHRRGRRRYQVPFPAGAMFHLLETRIQVIRLSPYRADLPARRSWYLDTATGLLACYFPSVTLSGRSKPSDPEITPLISAR